MAHSESPPRFAEYITKGSIVGLNYSGMHDTAIAVVGADANVSFAAALERYSRVKQDGRKPVDMLATMPWDMVQSIAIPTEASYQAPADVESRLLSVKLPFVRHHGLAHGKEFYDFLATLPFAPEFVCHQISHAASAFWPSGFDEAICLTYDGGMCNSPWFGGLFKASREKGIIPLERFNAQAYAKITSLYSFVTALLGFSPNKHEGKITGLAAQGIATPESRALLRKWFEEEFLDIESTMEWVFPYDNARVPTLVVNDERMASFRASAAPFEKEVMAATVQELAESHVLDILSRAKALGWESKNICLAGGLFANVKINQRIAAQGFARIFVAPPMTDDGAALGAAWHVASRNSGFVPPQPLRDVYFGERYERDETLELLAAEGIVHEHLDLPEKHLASLLAANKIIAVFQGRMEFGPRSLGNRSILASAAHAEINDHLNKKLHRTEFMPFAPIGRIEDAPGCYYDFDRVAHCAEFMTITVDCTPRFQTLCPAVVHKDGTARPQVVTKNVHPFLHALLSEFSRLTGEPALINTSFNIHEEPIVCSPSDALQGFFESGLDYLYLGDGILVSYESNAQFATTALRRKIGRPTQKSQFNADLARFQSERADAAIRDSEEKEKVIQSLKTELDVRDAELTKKEKVIFELDAAYKATMESLRNLEKSQKR